MTVFYFSKEAGSDRRPREFRLFPWRQSLAFRNEVIRSTVLAKLDNHIIDVSGAIQELRRVVSYHDLGKRDRELFRQYIHWLRTITGPCLTPTSKPHSELATYRHRAQRP